MRKLKFFLLGWLICDSFVYAELPNSELTSEQLLKHINAGLSSTMAGAGFDTLCSEAAVNMIENDGNPGRTLQAMREKNIVKTVARSVTAAGLTGALGVGTAPTSVESFAKEFLARSAVSTTMAIAFDGVKPGDAIRQGALNAAVQTVGTCIANKIGDLADSKMGTEQIGNITQEIFLGFLGAGIGAGTAAIMGQDVGKGATSGAIGAVVGHSTAKISGSKALGDLVAVTVAMMTDQDVGIAYMASNNATTYNFEMHPGDRQYLEEVDIIEEGAEVYGEGVDDFDAYAYRLEEGIAVYQQGIDEEIGIQRDPNTSMVERAASRMREAGIRASMQDNYNALAMKEVPKAMKRFAQGEDTIKDQQQLLMCLSTAASSWALRKSVSDAGKSSVKPAETTMKGLKITQSGRMYGTHRDLTKAGAQDSHHIIQHAAAKKIPGYNFLDAPAVQLRGPSQMIGTEHQLATKVQRASGGGNYSAERRIGYKALRKAGVSENETRSLINHTDQYFQKLGVKPDTKTTIPGNRKGTQ